MRRIVSLSCMLLAAACSQRAPWGVVPSPSRAAASSSSGGRGPGADTRHPTGAALATAAPVESALVANVGSLYFPVAGMDGTGLQDSFGDPRDAGERRHNAIDIMAPRGTPVLSVQDGRVLKLSNSAKGGISLYATDVNGQYVFYYAHLDRYHDGVRDGQPLMRGDTIGYVGTTGNAPANVPHLHFQLMAMPADGRYWDGVPLNPFSLLRKPEVAP